MPIKDMAKRREAQAAWARKYAAAHGGIQPSARARREWVQQQKARPCADCGIEYPHYVMQFDHVRGEKVGSISDLLRGSNIAAIKAEIEKCEVVCANCHATRTYSRKMEEVVQRTGT